MQEWIKPPRYQEDLENILKPQKKNKTSSTWILGHPRYRDWLNGKGNGLWISGRPGCGKSVLASVIVDSLHEQSRIPAEDDEHPKDHVGSVFCCDKTKRTSLAVKKILIWQLLEQGPTLTREQKWHVVSAWHAISDTGPAHQEASEATLLQLLGLILQSFRRVYVVIDGLDECNQPEQVMREVLGICSGASKICHLRVLFVSQKSSRIVEELPSDFQCIDLDGHDVRENSNLDIEIATLAILGESKDPGITYQSNHLKDAILRKCDGMILWATLAAKHLVAQAPLLNFHDLLALSRLIDDLPSKMTELYEHLLERCFPNDKGIELHAHALAILQWVLWSTRPLRIEELYLALNVSQATLTSKDGFCNEDIRIERLRFQIGTVCYPLLSIQQDSTVIIVHATFKDFIQQRTGSGSILAKSVISRLGEAGSSFKMAQTCLKYLNEPQFRHYQNVLEDVANSRKFDARYRFFNYATLNWVQHWKRCSPSSQLDPAVATLFHGLIRGEQGLTWLEGYMTRNNAPRSSLSGLQAEVNRIFGWSGNRRWLEDLLKVMLDIKMGIFGSLMNPFTRGTAVSLAWLYKSRGQVQEATSLYNAVFQQLESQDRSGSDTIIALSNLALAQSAEGNFRDAESNLVRVLEDRKRSQGENGYGTLTVMGNLATVYNKLNRHAEAETLLKRVIQGRTEQLGEYHPDTAIAKNNLASVLRGMGKYEEAKLVLEDLNDNSPLRSGSDQLAALRIKHNLAMIYSVLGEYQKSERLGGEVLQVRASMLGEDHADTLITLNNLAFSYFQQSRYKDAEELSREAVKRSRAVLGVTHPSTLKYQQNLAATLGGLYLYQESRILHQFVYDEREKKLGKEHIDTMASLSHLAAINRELGNFSKAEKQQAQVAQFFTAVAGSDQIPRLNSLTSLAYNSYMRSRYVLAAELAARGFERRREILGDAHPDTIRCLSMIGVYKKGLGLWGEAEQILNEVLTKASKVWHADHEDYLGCQRHIAQNQQKRGLLGVAEEELERLVERYKALFGENHRFTLFATEDLASVYFDQDRFDDAAALSRKILDSAVTTLSENHPHLLTIQLFVTQVEHAQGDLKGAKARIRSVVAELERLQGKNHPLTLNANATLALILKDEGEIIQAKALLVDVVRKGIEHPGFWHPDTLSHVDDLSMICNTQSRLNEAKELQRLAFEAREKFLGTEHPHSRRSGSHMDQISKKAHQAPILSERLLSFIPVWNPTSVDSLDPLIDAIKSKSSEDYRAWFLKRTVQEMNEVLGEDHWESVESGRKLAMYDISCGNVVGAVAPLKRAWEKQKEMLGPASSEALKTLFELSKCWKELGTFWSTIHLESPNALSLAIKADNRSFFDFLLVEKIDIEQDDEDGLKPLMLAVQLNRTSMVRQLLEAGASTKWASDCFTPLHMAAKVGHSLIVGLLVQYEANTNALCPDGHSAIFYASAGGHLSAVEKLLSSEPMPNVDLGGPSTDLPLHITLYYDYLEITEVLITAKASLEAKCSGLTPVAVAVLLSREHALKILLSRGALPNPFFNGALAIHCAARNGFRNVLNILLDAGADMNARDDRGLTPLHWASAMGHECVVEDLIAKGASLEIKSNSGFTPLLEAAENGHFKVVQRLVESKADLMATCNTGATALIYGATVGSLEVVEYLLNNKADPMVRSAESTILHQAVIGKNKVSSNAFSKQGLI